MKPRALRILLFATFLILSIAVLRLALGTIAGVVVMLTALIVRLLWIVYRAAEAFAVTLWSISEEVAERIEDALHRRAMQKESRHATRLL
jgi:hypothetical protein